MTTSFSSNSSIDTAVQAVLVGVITRGQDACDVEASLDELERLLDTAGGTVFARVIQSKDSPDPRTYIGSGKVQEIRELCEGNEISLVVFDEDLSPIQIRNLEKDFPDLRSKVFGSMQRLPLEGWEPTPYVRTKGK